MALGKDSKIKNYLVKYFILKKKLNILIFNVLIAQIFI